MRNSFDLIVIGAGSGGLAAAKRAAAYGAKVAVVEGDRVGGTCVIRGCVPKKLLVYGSSYRQYIDDAPSYGVNLNKPDIDSSILLNNVRCEVDRLNILHKNLLEKSGIELIKGWASFIDSHNILIDDPSGPEKHQKRIFGERILIAIGGEPVRPAIQGSDLGLVSDDIFRLKKFPKEIIIVGAGFIACEFACIFNNLGVKVRQLIRGDNLLRDFDNDLSKLLQKKMEDDGIQLHFKTAPASIEKEYQSLIVKTTNTEIFKSETILFATGRSPKLNGMKLENAGIALNQNRISTDVHQRTNVPNIYAVGDVTNQINLTPVAIDEGRAFADTVYGNKPRTVNYDFVPKAVFSQPEIASVGLSEQQANELYGTPGIQIYKAKFRPMSKSIPKADGLCLLKLVVLGSNNKILGCHMIGEHAAEIIQMASISLLMGATKSDFDRTMALHPTISEEFVTMKS